MATMNYADWMAGTTRGILTPRSMKLQAIDAALKNYEDRGKTRALLILLKTALDAWIAEKGLGWKGTLRNRNGTVELLQKQINDILGPGFAIDTASLQQKKQALVAPPSPVQVLRNSLSSPDFARRFANDIKNHVHKQWTSLTGGQRATRMHKALADLFPDMDMPAPGLDLVVNLGGAEGQFDCTAWKLQVASNPFGSATQPSKHDFVEAAKTIYHEGRHCEQWFHMARYASSGGQTAQNVADSMDIPLIIATNACQRKMKPSDGMFLLTKAWFQSVYGDSALRAITYAAMDLKRTGNAALMSDMRLKNHQRYSTELPEEADAWGTEALLDTAYVWP